MAATTDRLKLESSKSFESTFRNDDRHRHNVAQETPFLFDAGKGENFLYFFVPEKPHQNLNLSSSSAGILFFSATNKICGRKLFPVPREPVTPGISDAPELHSG
ncbi:MAG: hypothetical protein WCS42_23430 [Verrucomicrobiota bacterium]